MAVHQACCSRCNDLPPAYLRGHYSLDPALKACVLNIHAWLQVTSASGQDASFSHLAPGGQQNASGFFVPATGMMQQGSQPQNFAPGMARPLYVSNGQVQLFLSAAILSSILLALCCSS